MERIKQLAMQAQDQAVKLIDTLGKLERDIAEQSVDSTPQLQNAAHAKDCAVDCLDAVNLLQ